MAASPSRRDRSERQERVVRRRRAARLAAVQALYQAEISSSAPDKVALEFLQHRLSEDLDGLTLGDIDQQLFLDVFRGTHGARRELDDMLMAVIAEDWRVERLDSMLRHILRAAAWELGYHPQAPAKRSEEHTSELQSRGHLVCRLLLEKKNKTQPT